MSWLLAGRPLRRVLISRLRYLGDVVMSTVVAEVLRRGDPGIDLGFLCEAGHAPVLAGHPHLDRVHCLASRRRGQDAAARGKLAFPAPDGSGTGGRILPAHAGPAMVRELGRTGYDLAIDLFFNPRSAWLLRLSGIPLRIGGTSGLRRHLYSYCVQRQPVSRDNPGFDAVAPGGLGEHLCRLEPLVHGPSGLPFPQWLLRNIEPGSLRPQLTRTSPGPLARKAMAGLGLAPDTSYIVVAPAATWESKEWPLERWQSFLGLLGARRSEPVVVLQPPGPARDWSGLAASLPPGRVGLLPVLDLPEVVGLLSGASLLVSVDGGVMHAGVGLGTPTVGLFGPTRTDAWFPYESAGPYRVLATYPDCHPCHLHECQEFVCLPGLKPELVLQTAEQLLGETGNKVPDEGV